MTDRELMQQALEALKAMQSYAAAERKGLRICDDAIAALRERLAQQEPEPFEYWNAVEGWVKIDEVREHFDSVGCGTIYKTAGEDRVPLYTAPQQRKPLTEQEIGLLTTDPRFAHIETPTLAEFARAVIAKATGEKK